LNDVGLLNMKKLLFVLIIVIVLLAADNRSREPSEPKLEIPRSLTVADEGVLKAAYLDRSGEFALLTGDGKIRIIDPASSPDIIRILNVSEYRVTEIVQIPDSKMIIWGDSAGCVGTVDVNTGIINSEEIHHGAITSIRLSPASLPHPSTDKDEKAELVAAVGSEDSTISILRVNDLARIKELTDPGAPVFDLAFSSDGSLLAAGGLGTETMIYNSSDWSVEDRIPTPTASWVTALTFVGPDPSLNESNDILVIAYSSGRVEWHTIQPIGLLHITNLSAWANDLLVLDEGSTLILGGMDGNITLISIEGIAEKVREYDEKGDTEGPGSQDTDQSPNSSHPSYSTVKNGERGRGDISVIENDHPVFSISSSGHYYDFASTDANGTLCFWNIEDAQPIVLAPEPGPGSGTTDYDGGSTDALVTALILVSVMGVLVALVTYAVSKDPVAVRTIPTAKLIAPPPRKTVPKKDQNESSSKVINIFIRDSVINRSNFSIEDEDIEKEDYQ